MGDVISDYLKWKQQGGELRAKAKAAMEIRFRELLSEAATLAEEYKTDFGAVLKPPPGITAFRYQVGRPKKAAKKPATAPETQAAAPAPKPAPDRKILALQGRLDTLKKKLDAAKAAGKPTRDWEDKIYEVEDAIRLAQNID